MLPLANQYLSKMQDKCCVSYGEVFTDSRDALGPTPGTNLARF